MSARNLVSIPSPCASMIAFYNLTTSTLHISLIGSHIQKEKTVEIGSDIRRHSGAGKASSEPPRIGQTEWEEVLPGNKATKIAVLVVNYSMVLIYDIREPSLPIIVRQTREEGISKFQWVPPVIESQREGAYINCKQVLLFTDNCLRAKLYSLDYTTILCTIDSPVANTGILTKPGLGNAVWALVADQILLTPLPPLLLLFANSGSESTLFHTFLLTDDAGTVRLSSPTLTWSPQGNWVLDFSSVESLFGFCMDIYNPLGLGYTSSNSQAGIRAGSPVASLNWLTDGIHENTGDSATSLVTFGALSYVALWASVGSSEIVVVAGSLNRQLTLLCYSVMRLKMTKFAFLSRTVRNGWRQVESSFRKILTKGIPLDNLNAVSSYENCVAIQCLDTLLVFFITEDETTQPVFRAALQFEKPIDTVIHLKRLDNNTVFIVASQCVAVYNATHDRARVLMEATVIHDVVVHEGEQVVLLIKTANNGISSDWRILSFKYDELLPEQPSLDDILKRRLPAHLPQVTNDEITDTFVMKPRA